MEFINTLINKHVSITQNVKNRIGVFLQMLITAGLGAWCGLRACTHFLNAKLAPDLSQCYGHTVSFLNFKQ